MNRVFDILGVSEFDLVNIQDRSKFIEDNEFINIVTGEDTYIGTFTTPTIAELKQQINFDKLQDANNVKISVKVGVDIGQLQGTIKTNDKAMVQVASNFNCLEVPNRNTDPNNGRLVEDHVHDNTQGPAATFGTLAATLYRCHFVFGSHGQTLQEQLNLLENVEEYFGTPVNGKLTLTGKEKQLHNNVDKVIDQIKAGLHVDCAIMYDRKGKLPEPHQHVDQVFNSTINLRSYGVGVDHDYRQFISRVLLRAAYESVYLSAIVREREILYLTLIGGGVFKNSIKIIVEEIENAHNKYAKYSKLKKVVLCLYQPDDYILKYFS